MACVGETITFKYRADDIVKVAGITRIVTGRLRLACGDVFYTLDDCTAVRECQIESPLNRGDVVCCEFKLGQVVRVKKTNERIFLKSVMFNLKGVLVYTDNLNGIWTEDELI